MDNRSSFAASDTTYHSFHDVELFEPPSPPKNNHSTGDAERSRVSDERPPTAVKMQRQDSGYESYTPTPRTSTSGSRPTVARHISNTSTSGVGPSRPRTRPMTRRSTKSYCHPHVTKATPPLYVARPDSSQLPQSSTLFQFPSPPESRDDIRAATSEQQEHHVQGDEHEEQQQVVPEPPQTTHYWTSDSTRRLEYAAIDAASRGVKGWIRRNLVPDCFVPKDNRHVSFDDDSGSVRRYRLELEEEPGPCERARRRKGWPFWPGRKNSV